MKKIVFSVLTLLFMAGIANAQVKESQDSTQTHKTQNQKKPYGAKNKPYGAKNKKMKRSNWDSINKTGFIDTTNPGANYKSKGTGQTATPAGQEATGTNSSNSNNPKNAGSAPDTSK